MTAAIDANILLFASDTECRHHQRALQVLEALAMREEVFYLPWPVIMAYLRIATHPSIFGSPISPREAVMNIEAILELPHAQVLGEGPRFWACYREICGSLCVRGNLVPDAHIAALLLENDVRRIITHDGDFRKFAFLEVEDPF